MTQQDSPGNRENISRRDAMRRLASGALTAALAGPVVGDATAQAQEAGQAVAQGRDFLFFSKPFQSLSYDQLGELAAKAGYTGLEFPVRPSGHVEPKDVERELPKAVEAFRKHGITIPLISTGINEVGEQQSTQQVLRTAAELGIPRFRMAYYKYDLKQAIAPQLESCAPKLDELVALASDIGIRPLYQNHSGAKYIGAPVWDIYALIKKHSPEKIGLAFDIGHAIIEGTKCWQLNFALIQNYIDVAYIKDPCWDADHNRFEWSPIGTGMIPKEYYKMLAKTGFDGPMSIHVEYLDHKNPAHHDQFCEAIRDDLKALRQLAA